MLENDDLTPRELREISKIRMYKQPTCPGCGNTMTLTVLPVPQREGEEKKREFSVRYYCKPGRTPKEGCGIWATNVLLGPLPVSMAEQAWKDAWAGRC